MLIKEHLINGEKNIVIKTKNQGNTYREIAKFFSKTLTAFFNSFFHWEN